MSAHRGMIFNYMIPVALLILMTTVFGTMSLRAVSSHQRRVIVESIENILDKCHHIDAHHIDTTVNCNWNGDYVPTLKCCDEMQKRSDELQKVEITLHTFITIAFRYSDYVDCESAQIWFFAFSII